MEKIKTIAGYILVIMLGTGIFNSCTKTAAEPETRGPKETVVLPMMNVNNNQVGSLFIDDMNGIARARIAIDEGHYTSGKNMKTNVTLTTSSGTVVYAQCTDLDGKTGKCSTFPITVLSNNAHATFSDVTATEGIVFNVLDENNHVVARSTKYTIVIDN